MKHLPSVAAALLMAAMAGASPALASGTAWTSAQMLPDPSLANGPVFKPAAATAGTAVVSAASDGPLLNCSRENPCAMATPARDHVVVVVSHAPVAPVSHTQVRSASLRKVRPAAQPDVAGKPAS